MNSYEEWNMIVRQKDIWSYIKEATKEMSD